MVAFFPYQRGGAFQSAGKSEEGVVQFIEIRKHTIIAGTPKRRGFFRLKTNHRKIASSRGVFSKARKILSNVDGGMVPDDRFTLVDRKNGSQHPLILCVGLAEVEVRHV